MKWMLYQYITNIHEWVGTIHSPMIETIYGKYSSLAFFQFHTKKIYE